MSDLVAYAGAFVVGEPSEIAVNDPDEDGDLHKYDIGVTYTTADGKTTMPWTIKDRIPIVTKWKDEQGVEHEAVNSMILKVIPVLPLPGCLGLLIPSFPRFTRKDGQIKEPPTTGTVTGTLTPPPGGGGARVGAGLGPRQFKVMKPSIFYGTNA
jgi:hypothetical protein